jgi:hypothetical protein
MNEIEIEKKKN